MSFVKDVLTQLQIREGSEDNSKIIFLISQQKHILNPHQRHLIEMVLMMGHKICCFFFVFFFFHEKNMANYPFIIPVTPIYLGWVVLYDHGLSCVSSFIFFMPTKQA